MNKRVLCFLTALLLVLPGIASPAGVCDHLDPNNNYLPYPYEVIGATEAKPGVPGYSGDACCSNCHAVIYPGFVTYAEDPDLRDPTRPSGQDEGPEDPDKPDTPDTPDTPNTPDTPENPDNPVNPDTPDNPDNPDNPDTPDYPHWPWRWQ